jgi:putative transposase
MARRPRIFAPGLLYHVIVRGNQKQKTFLGRRDYQVYLERLARYRQKHNVTVYAYCLMSNHVHLLLECRREPLNKFMQGLQQSYTQYFNHYHDKAGHLFQGRYKAIICEKDEYLSELIRYIHLNPVRAKVVRRAEEYLYSGHWSYIESKPTEVIDPPRAVLDLFGGPKAYQRFVADGLGEGHKEEHYEVDDQRFLGGKQFGEVVLAEVGAEPERKVKKPSLSKIVEDLARRLKVSPEDLRKPNRTWNQSRARILIAHVLIRHSGFKVGEVAAYFGRDQTTISSLLSRFSQRAQQDTAVQAEVERLAQIV